MISPAVATFDFRRVRTGLNLIEQIRIWLILRDRPARVVGGYSNRTSAIQQPEVDNAHWAILAQTIQFQFPGFSWFLQMLVFGIEYPRF